MSADIPASDECEPLLKPQAVIAIADVITGGSGSASPEKRYGVYRSGTDLRTFFANCDADLDLVGMSRVPAVRAALSQLNREPDGVKPLLRLIEAAVDPSAYPKDGSHAETITYLNERLNSSGLRVCMIGSRWRVQATATHSFAAQTLQEHAQTLDYDSVQRDTERALLQADTDPEDAITAACSMIESVCYCILEEMGQPPPAKKDVSHLVSTVQKHLNLSPERTDIEPEIKQVLGGLSNVANGVGTLRTHAGDAHGRSKGTGRADGRVARLAIHAASTISLFFIETWQKRQGDTPHGDGK